MIVDNIKGIIVLDAFNNKVSYKKLDIEEIKRHKGPLSEYVETIVPNSSCVWAIVTKNTKIDLNELSSKGEKDVYL